MKKIISILLALTTLFTVMTFTGCKASLKRAVIICCPGSYAAVGSMDKAPYKIKELNITSEGNFLDLGDYVYDVNGTTYQVTNSKGKQIGYVKLSPKSSLYNGETFEFNLDNYEYKTIIITPEMSKVKIYSSNPNLQRELYIQVDYRETPLDIELNNVNIFTEYLMPVFFSGSDVGINLICKGKNTIKAGNRLVTDEEYQYYKAQTDNFTTSLTVASMPWALYVEGAIKTVEVFANNSSADQFVNKFETALKDMLTMTETYWSAVENVIQGENGADGYEGSYAVQAYNLCISGDGNLEIHGGDGGNGYNGSGAILGNTKGGRGGDSGSAIFCKKYVNVMSSSNYIIKSGIPGAGGKGNQGIGDQGNLDGRAGNSPKAIQATYAYHK